MTSSLTQGTAGLYTRSFSVSPRPWIEGKLPSPVPPHACPRMHAIEWAATHMNPSGAHPAASRRRDSLARLRAQHAQHQSPHALLGWRQATAMRTPHAGWQPSMQPAQPGGQTHCPPATDGATGLRRRNVTRPRNVEASAAADSAAQPPAAGGGSRLVGHKLVAFILLVLGLGVANRVLYRVALVPMANYVFFLAQFQNFGYLLVYFSTLGLRYRSGRVTKAMLAIDKRPLWAIGACEAVAQLLFMISASHLPGPLLPIINQSYLCWNLLFAAIILGARYSKSQLGGAALIVLGVVLAAMPASATAGLRAATAGAPVEPIYIATAVLCFAFPALASIIKDITFRKERERLGQPLDIFMVNSFGSLFQSVFVLLLLPVNLAMVGVKLPELPGYLAEGARCFQGLTPSCGSDCTGAPMLVIAYVVANLAFNIAMLVLLRSVGAVSTTLVGSCLVPLTILAFLTLPLPLPPSAVGPNFAIGTAALCAGLLLFNWNLVVRPLLATLEGPTESVDLPAP